MPIKQLNKINVVDVESTCWSDKATQGSQPSEIIEIGICTIDVKSLCIEQKQSIFVIPQYSTVSKFCTELTTITQEQLGQHGVYFRQAVEHIKSEYDTLDRLWVSYGDYDRHMFEKMCALYHVDYPFVDTHINVKSLFALKYRLPKEIGLGGALAKLDMHFDGTPHRGCDDAYNIAKITRRVIYNA